jgi:acetolactate synthase I/II/III large subunit
VAEPATSEAEVLLAPTLPQVLNGERNDEMTWQPLREERSVPEAIIESLAEGGVRFVLGMPGGYTGPLWKAMHDHPLVRAVQVREESIGSIMAEAYGRLTNQPVVVMGQGEWIVGNAGQGFLEALLGSSPMVILTEMTDWGDFSHHAPYQAGTGDYGTWDARTALAGVTKRVMVSHSPVQAVQHTQLALKHAMTGDPGPVAVVFHSRSLQGAVGPSTKPRIFPTQAYLPPAASVPAEGELAGAAEALLAASRPVIVAGNGVRLSGARSELVELARVLGAPVATTSSGKGVFDESDPLAVGTVGLFGWASANFVVSDADVVLAVGTKLSPSDTASQHTDLIDPARQTVIHIDTEPLNVGWTVPVQQALLGDAAAVLGRLRTLIDDQADGRAQEPSAAAIERIAALPRHTEGPEFDGDDVPFLPQRIVTLIQKSLPKDAIITCDAGENRLFMMQWFRATDEGDYLQPAAGGGMGYAVPAALGARLAHPERPVLAVCGDGGFAMSLHALMTAVQERLPIAIVVFNNGALGWVLHSMGPQAVAASFDSFDHAGIARSIGCDGLQVSSSDELAAALASVGDLKLPLVIDVPTSLTTSFRDVTQRFPDLA